MQLQILFFENKFVRIIIKFKYLSESGFFVMITKPSPGNLILFNFVTVNYKHTVTAVKKDQI